MAQWEDATLTERQRKWFASVREGLERDTGRSLDQWAEIARGCPETAPRARQRWLKEHHGLAQNRAATVLDAAFPAAEPETDEDPLWVDPAARAVFTAVAAMAQTLPETLVGRRKGYTAFSRKLQYAAIRPVKVGGAALGLALTPEFSPRLGSPKREPWSERLKSVLALRTPAEADEALVQLLRAAWERS